MFRSRCTLIACLATLVMVLPCVSIGQTAPDNKSGTQEPVGGFKLTPNVVVQEEMDEATLTKKVSVFMGYNLMKNLRAQGQAVDMGKLFEGMKAAVNGPDQKSYIAGYQLMKNLQDQGADLELAELFQGMTNATEGKELGMSQEQVQAMMTRFGKLVEARAIAKMKKASADNLAAADAYMAKSAASNPNIKKMENGIQYEVLVDGTGPMPTREDLVKVDYHGTFLDGSVFDSSVNPPSGAQPAPAELVVGGFVPGFAAVLQSMKVGSKWRVVIPGPLAYGVQGRGKIGPNQALIFEVSLLEILKKPAVSEPSIK